MLRKATLAGARPVLQLGGMMRVTGWKRAVLTWSLPGFLFVFWTACNLVPRADAIYKKYAEIFPDETARYKPKRIIPFLY